MTGPPWCDAVRRHDPRDLDLLGLRDERDFGADAPGASYTTGVKPMRGRMPRLRRVRAFMPTLRSRGLTNSSIPKLMSVRAMPTSAMHRPAGTNHHQAPRCSARLFCAPYRMVPQFQSLGSPMPMKASVVCVSTANTTVATKPEAMMAVRFGMISAVMMRHVLSPLARAASTKSRRRSDRVWARSTRAPHAQPVTAITAATVTPPTDGSWPAMMMMSGSCGMTRKTLASMDRPSSPIPPM